MRAFFYYFDWLLNVCSLLRYCVVGSLVLGEKKMQRCN